MRTRLILISVAVATLLAGCPTTDPIALVPNTAPSVRLEQPIPPESGDPVQVPFLDSIRFVAQVADAEDPLDELPLRWVATRTDTVADPVTIGEGFADATGFAEFVIGGLEPGVYQVAARITDLDGASAEASVPVQFLGANTGPDVVISTPQPDSLYLVGEVVTFTGTATDDNGAANLSIEWTSSLDGLLDVSPPTQSGLLTFSRQNLTLGEHTITLNATDDSGATAADTVDIVVAAADNPPFDPVIAIEPPTPFTDDDLRCVLVQGSADPEGLPITYTYRWFRNGVLTLESSDTVAASQTERLDEWICEVTASDGTLLSNAVQASVTVGNTTPTATGVELTPDPAFEDTVLVCAGEGFADADGDPEDWQASWFVNNVLAPAPPGLTLDGTYFDKDDTVVCELSPFDGVDAGAVMTSDPIVISNSPPLAPGVDVTPGPQASLNSALTCLISSDAVDIDGDQVLNPASYEVSWLVDGVLDATTVGLWIVPAARTALGDEWTCQVRATDGTDWGAYGTSSTIVLPDPGDLVLSEFLARPSAVSDVAGEWVELYNAAAYPIDLTGFELHDDSNDTHIINAPLILPPGAYVVLARNVDYGSNGGVVAAYEYSNFVLDDGSDEIVLSFDGIEIDRFEYDTALYTSGDGYALAWNIDNGLPDAAANDAATAWCPAGSNYSGPLSDFGTPGGANDGCACFASDSDADGFGDDASCAFTDCDDTDPLLNPAATDICENGIDENCDGIDAICLCSDTDSDGDGWGDGAACNPADCEDLDPTIYPTAFEACDGIDQDCSGVIDDGDPALQCPPTFQVVSTACNSAECQVASCQPGYYDTDTIYSSGCECLDDIAGPTCNVALDLGPVDAGDVVGHTGKLPLGSSEDWLIVSFPVGASRPGAGVPSIEMTVRPDSSFVFDVYVDCNSTLGGCGSGGFAQGIEHWTFADNNSSGLNGFSTHTAAWPGTLYIRVYRGTSAPTCGDYTISITR